MGSYFISIRLVEAVHVNVELILGSAWTRVYGQLYLPVLEGARCGFLHVTASLSRIIKVRNSR
jgi:hypothetical protein